MGPRLPAAVHRPLRAHHARPLPLLGVRPGRSRAQARSCGAANPEPAKARLGEALEHFQAPLPRSPSCSRKPRKTPWPSTSSPQQTGPSSEAPTRPKGSTARSAAEPTLSASSPTIASLIRHCHQRPYRTERLCSSVCECCPPGQWPCPRPAVWLQKPVAAGE